MNLIQLTGVLCLGMTAMAQDVQFDYARSADFRAYRTYQWAADSRLAHGPNQLMDQNIKRAVERQLFLKGLRRVDSGADMHLTYQVAVQRERHIEAYGVGPRWAGPGRVTTSTTDTGRIVIEFVDPFKKQVLWRGSVAKTLDIKSDPDKNYRNLEKTIAKLFQNYPALPLGD